MRAWGLRIAKRSSMLCAIVAVARKLASILHRMWVSESDFHVGFGAKVTQTAAIEAGTVTDCTDHEELSLRVASSMLKRSKYQRSARAVSVPWRGRETGNVRYLLPAAALRGRERRTAWTALFTNLMKSMRQPKC